jgi:pyruvate,water dikinase
VSDLILQSREAAAAGEECVGGKAWNMAWLSRQAFPVPAWWVMTTTAFAEQLATDGTDEWIAEQITNLDTSDTARVQQVAESIHNRVASLPLASALKTVIADTLPTAALDSTFYAVRSSVVGEDAEGASFAGQMDSFLYQKGLAAIEQAVVGVMASAFNPRALLYRIQKGLPITDIRAAVIIQEMVDADVAGVMFTAHPMTGSRKHALISGTYGCGEGIVSGLCNTDEFTVALFENSIEAQVNEKDVSLVFDRQNDGGTIEVPVAPEKQNTPCLDDAQVLALRDLGRRIAELKRFPQDIEWAIRDGQLHILQTRPVTSLPAPSAPTDEPVVWDNSNIQESYCGVTTPLTFTFAARAYATVYEQTMRVLGVTEKEIQNHRHMLDNMLGLIRGRVYYNINNWYRGLLFLPSFSTNKSDLERMMGLTDPVDMVQDQNLTFAEKLSRLPQLLRALFFLMRGFRRMDKLVADFRQMFDDAYKGIDRSRLHMDSIAALLEKSRRLDREVLERWTTPIVNDFYVMMMNGRLHRWLEKAGVEHVDAVQNNLLSGEEGIESTEPTKMLLSMCDDLRADPALRETVESTANEQLMATLQVHAPAFHARCEEYIERYGDRTMGELKLESITLRQDTAFMFSVLKNFLSRDDLTLASLTAREAHFRDEAEADVFPRIEKQFGARGLRKFRQTLARCRAAIRNRENMRLARTRLFGLYRDIYLEIGEQLHFHGELDDPRDIFYLTLDELYAWQDGRCVQTRFKPLVAARREEFAGYEAEQEPAHHFWTRGVPYLHNSFEYPHATDEAVDGDALKGTGCYPGVVESPIRLIFSPDDELSLDGQILCTVRTDPGWAPLFPTAGGILVERGSTLSHSAVVARELGIPAIVGIPNITRILNDRERVRMDGASGVIERLDQIAEASNDAD